MPNHVTNELVVCGLPEHLLAFKNHVSGVNIENEETVFSLHRVIPQPEELNKTVSGSGVAEALWLVDEEAYDNVKNKRGLISTLSSTEMLNRLSQKANQSFQTKEEAKEWFSDNDPGVLEFGEIHSKAFRMHGFVDWYSWRIQNWGTKWEVYWVNIGEGDGCLTYSFSTAWSPPTPVLEKLAQEHRDLTFEHKYFDEGHNFWGIDRYESGELTDERNSLDVDYESLCEELLGYNPKEDADTDE